jgi:rhodanese-related sulfurtransferase/thioredoxin-related protein
MHYLIPRFHPFLVPHSMFSLFSPIKNPICLPVHLNHLSIANMKTIFTTLLLSLLASLAAARAAELTWLTDISKAQAQAEAEKKSVLIIFTGSDWCPACIEMDHQVFASPQFIDYARRALILVKIDFPEKSTQSAELQKTNEALKAKFNVGGLPTLVLLDDDGSTAFQEAGYGGGGPAEVLPKLQHHVNPLSPVVTTPGFKNLSVDEFAKMAADKQNIILDVRTANEFHAGHIPGAVNLDVTAPDFTQKAGALDKNKTYLVHCASGVRSERACKQLTQLDFPNLYNLPGGFHAWAAAGEPVEK